MSRSRVGDRLKYMEESLEKLNHSIERIELVTIIREPSTGVAADAYTGLRKQIIAAVSERTAHLHQLAQFDSTLRAGATPDELSILVREWLGQASLEVVEDTSLDGAFEFVGPKDAPGIRVVRPAYVDSVTGRVIRSGVAERLTDIEPMAAIGAPDATKRDGPLDETRVGQTEGAVLDDGDETVKDEPRAKNSRTNKHRR